MFDSKKSNQLSNQTEEKRELLQYAEVAELADAHGSGPCGSNTLRVRLPSSARQKRESREQSDEFSAFFV